MEANSENSGKVQQTLAGKYLTFSLSSERYGLEILKVQEIIGITNITRVPKCPPYIKGVINLRGKIIPLIDLRLKFGLRPVQYDHQTCIIVVHLKRGEQLLLIGLIVDTVLEVIDFANSEIETAPQYGTHIESSFIVGMGRKGEASLNILIDIEKVFSTEAFSKLLDQGS